MTSTWLQTLLQREGLRLNPYAIVSKVRSGRRLHSYSDAELEQIFLGIVGKNQMTLHPEAEREIRQELRRLCAGRDETFGNAREMRKLFEKISQAQAVRLGSLPNLDSLSNDELLLITADDVRLATG